MDDAERLDFLRRRSGLEPAAFDKLSEMASRAGIPFKGFAAPLTISEEDLEYAAHRAGIAAMMGLGFILARAARRS